MYPFTRCNDYLWLQSDKTHQGLNTINWRAVWFGLSAITFTNKFTPLGGGSDINGAWVYEGGDQSLPPASREQRALGKKGKMTFAFTGTNCTLRVGLNPGWGVGTVRIDGQAPSAIPGLLTALDTVSCDSDFYGLLGAEYYDVLLADGLDAGAHTLEIYCNNLTEGTGGFFVVSGCKVLAQINRTRTLPTWIMAPAERLQPETLTLLNESGEAIENVSIEFDSSRTADEAGTPLGLVAVGTILPGAESSVTFIPRLAGTESQGDWNAAITMTAEYQDPAGIIERSALTIVPVDSPALTYAGTWNQDTSNGELRAFTDIRGASCTFTQTGDALTLRVQREYGWGTFRVSKNPVVKSGCVITTASNSVVVPDTAGLAIGQYVVVNSDSDGIAENVTITAVPDATHVTLSANATATGARDLAFLTSIATVSCHDAVGGGFYIDVPISGCGAGDKTLRLDRTEITAGAYVVWSRLSFSETLNYTSVTEVLQLIYALAHVPAWPVADTRLETLATTAIAWDDPTLTAYDAALPRDNRTIVETQLETRFPTFAVIYRPGYVETLKHYDIAIVDPFGITRQEVASLQALGIRVLVYVSFGEEDGTLSDEWDPASAQSPWIGDGQGPGGYASYYCKGGYRFGEQSECNFDRQRLEGVKACANSRTEYYTAAGRCSKGCGQDWRTGYTVWLEGGQCGAGFTSATNWQRSASAACSNAACPQYAPLNSNCPLYQQADNSWGQDFSILTPDYPDENGIWSSYYINPVPRGAGSWYERIRDHYLPILFGNPIPRSETLTVAAVTGGELGIKAGYPPLDPDEGITITDLAETFTYLQGVDYNTDDKLGVIKIHAGSAGAPAVVVGTQLKLTYSSKGLACDGVFMDTVDTVDVYPDPVFQAGMADLINDMKTLHPTRMFCSNRGFSILPDIIASCRYVMFESFLADYDWVNDTYQQITDPAAIAFNDGITTMLNTLREAHTFDVLGLNYCADGETGAALRQYIYEQTYQRGWLCWTSTILLDKLLPPDPIVMTTGRIGGNQWSVARVRGY